MWTKVNVDESSNQKNVGGGGTFDIVSPTL